MRACAPTAALLLALVLGACGSTQHRSAPSPTPSPTPSPRATPARRARVRSLAPPVARGRYRGPVPILMYHVIAKAPHRAAEPELWVPPKRFRAQLARLARAGYHGVTLSQVWAAWHGGPGLPRRPVVVSFDDGYDDQFTVAAPALRRLGWPGVINLQVDNLRAKGGLTPHDVRGLLARGWELAAHTFTHPDLTQVGAAQLEREVAGSRAALRHRFGVPVAFFCYPSGRYDATVEQAVRKAGYRGATTTQAGLARPGGDRFALPRIRVLPEDAPGELLQQLR
jgi:peptidoglycan/xylan/chitin deacetylase (PgdA/CDA1 family)